MVRTLKATAKNSHKIDKSACQAKICYAFLCEDNSRLHRFKTQTSQKSTKKASCFMPHHLVTVWLTSVSHKHQHRHEHSLTKHGRVRASEFWDSAVISLAPEHNVFGEIQFPLLISSSSSQQQTASLRQDCLRLLPLLFHVLWLFYLCYYIHCVLDFYSNKRVV